ncbi:enoyl-CoA hydratase/isomerase family protein [Pseudonocardia endophytica]|uniref:2-(1,2-epoxy-1,2-dihydrophenyl)acetyl-CoA isomerase n=1 Tax=Pseudonocardia endophytica TaxID=401976 RepID=A0A4R1HNZ9_PSEEN|nr:enoyl-CoA hydratase-related protein [Pseudonocardia endophytica]TCK22853.1 2-(1,2-epoxy-1,2-dihydrophenyl)acetyl-CoA isomerase [Pseudonocardia endophytica]
MADEPVLLSSDDGGVRTLTLNRPHRRNAVDRALWDALAEALAAITDDASVRAVVVTGAGGAFCAGADLSGGVPDEHPLRGMRRVNDIALLLHELPQPTVAAVDGIAVGAGWNLALGCDLVVATPGARFSQIFARRGLSLDFGGSWLLPRVVGLQQAKRIALLADILGADEALALGLVTEIVGEEELADHVAALAARLASGPPVALAQTKALLNSGVQSSMREALEAEARTQTINFATDAPEGLRAFVDRRDPDYTGTWRVT